MKYLQKKCPTSILYVGIRWTIWNAAKFSIWHTHSVSFRINHTTFIYKSLWNQSVKSWRDSYQRKSHLNYSYHLDTGIPFRKGFTGIAWSMHSVETSRQSPRITPSYIKGAVEYYPGYSNQRNNISIYPIRLFQLQGHLQHLQSGQKSFI